MNYYADPSDTAYNVITLTIKDYKRTKMQLQQEQPANFVDEPQIEIPEAKKLTDGLKRFYNDFFSKGAKDKYGEARGYITGAFLSANVEETEKTFKVKTVGRWYSFNGTCIEFLETGTYNKTEVYKQIKATKAGEISVAGLETKFNFFPETIYTALSDAGQLGVISRLRDFIPVALDPSVIINHPEYRTQLYKLLTPKVKADGMPAIELNKHYLLNNRYIVFLISSDYNYYTVCKNQDNIYLAENILIEGWGNSGKLVETLNAHTYGQAFKYQVIKGALLDIYTWKLVPDANGGLWISEFVESDDFDSIDLTEIPTFSIIKSLRGMNENVFMNTLNNYFSANGYPNLICTGAEPGIAQRYYSSYNFKTKNSEGNYEKIAAYRCKFIYNGLTIINGTENGWCYVSEDLVMVRSAWCQRVTRWSKEVAGVIDQRDEWNILDWITGPFFEKFGIEAVEAPFVFRGRISKKAERKAEILKKLKEQL